ncbi:MAG: stealth family protein [Bacteroidetes bacterium]|nr:stealth family protein [Bacteroidota bacterium]
MKKDLIDVVYTWVNGNDPKHYQKRISHLPQSNKLPAGAQKTRFGNVNELYYSLFSIFTFAPFVNKIYIITDGQKPELEGIFSAWFPKRKKDVEIIDHQEIFEGYEIHLPTFNSRTIESMLWRINGLAEKFVYFNDDMFLVRPIKKEDWFIGDTPVLRGKKTLAPFFHIFWQHIQLQLNSNAQIRPSYHLGQFNAAKVAGFQRTYFVFSHTPHPILKEDAKAFLELPKKIIDQQLQFKFRHYSQFNFLSYCYHLVLQKNRNPKAAPLALSYLQPAKRNKNYIENKLMRCENKEEIKFMCVQSLDLCSKTEQNKVLDWLYKRCLFHLEKNSPIE